MIHTPFYFYYRSIGQNDLRLILQSLHNLGVSKVREPNHSDFKCNAIGVLDRTMFFMKFPPDCHTPDQLRVPSDRVVKVAHRILKPAEEQSVNPVEGYSQEQSMIDIKGVAAVLKLDEQGTELLATWFKHNRKG